MGLFSSSKSSSTTNAQEAGFSEIGGNALAIQGSGNTVRLTDQGALRAAENIARESLRQVELAGTNTVASVSEAVKAVSESSRQETENIVLNATKWGAFALIAWAGFKAFGAWKS